MSYEHTTYCPFEMNHYQYSQGEEKAEGLGISIRPNYFNTMGTKLLYGRDFKETDNADSEQVVIVSVKTVEQYYKDTNAIGQTLRIWAKS